MKEFMVVVNCNTATELRDSLLVVVKLVEENPAEVDAMEIDESYSLDTNENLLQRCS